ncbi:MAG: hypothetical protein ICV52_19030 [Microcoleus sp. C1-bin4]|nr:hypothetical protein [Microcoleus sp. C1-bin4]
MLTVDKIFWLLAIGVTVVNAYIIKSRSREVITRHPELKEGYEKIFRGYLIYLNIPWIVMGIGILAGGVSDVFDYFYPRAGNPFVLAFHLSIIILWALSIYWIYFRGGAEFLVKHPGVVNIKSVLGFKVLFALMLLGGMFGLILMWSGDFPRLNFGR